MSTCLMHDEHSAAPTKITRTKHVCRPISLILFIGQILLCPSTRIESCKPPPVTETFASEVTLPPQMPLTLLHVQTSDASNPHSYSCFLTMKIHPEPRLCKSVTTHIHTNADAALFFVPS